MWNFNFIPFKYLFYHFMKTLPLALDALLCIGALLVPAFLASCREAPERQAQIRFGLFPNVTHVQGLVARHFSRTGEGWFEKRIFERTGKNISILWYAYNAGPSAMEAMFANSLDFTYVGPSPAINAYSKSNGTLLQIVAGAVQGGSGLVVPTHSEARTQKDFQGKIIATPQLGNTQDIACRTWLALGGVAVTQSRGDASILPTPNPEQISLFRQGKLDGSWTVEPWISRLEKEAGGKLLFLETDAVTTVLTAQKRILEKQPDVAQAIIEAHRELTFWIIEHPQEAQKIVVEELRELTRSSIDPSLILHAWPKLVPTNKISEEKLQAFAKDTVRTGFYKELPRVEGIIRNDKNNPSHE